MNTLPMERRRAVDLPMPPERSHGDLFGLRSAADAMLRKAALALSTFLLTLAAAGLYYWLATPVYKADTLVRIDSRIRDSLAPSAGAGAERNPAESERGNVPGEMEIITSREVLLPVIAATGSDIALSGARRYGLVPMGSRHGVEVPVFSVPSTLQGKAFRLHVQGGKWQLTDANNATVAEGAVGKLTSFGVDDGQARIQVVADGQLPSTKLQLRQLPPLQAHDELMKRLRIVELARESGVLRISLEDSNAERAAALLNAQIKAYLDFTVARKAGDGSRALQFSEAQLPALKARLEASENALATYQRLSSAAPVGTEADALLRQRTDLQRQSVELQIKRDQLAQNLTPEHPELAATIRQLGTVNSALQSLSGQASRLPEQGRIVTKLQRELQSDTQVYNAMLAHTQQLRIAGAGSGWLANARQLDRAMTPYEPLRPKLSAVLSVGAGAGLVLSLLAALVAQALKPKVTGAQELLSRTVPRTLAVIPDSTAQRRLMAGRLVNNSVDQALDEQGTHRLLARAHPQDPAIASLRSVCMALMLRARHINTKVVLVTAPSAGVGKTFVAANLAAVMAETGRRVLLLEADLAKHSLAHLVAIDDMAAGLTDLLSGSRTLEQVVHRHASANFDVILHGVRSHNPGTMMMSSVFDSHMHTLREHYDHIIINGAPVLPSSDALMVGQYADVALLVVRSEQSNLGDTRAAIRRLEQNGIKLEGVLFNAVKRHRLVAPVLS